jgi:metallo-beta-lactamase class B
VNCTQLIRNSVFLIVSTAAMLLAVASGAQAQGAYPNPPNANPAYSKPMQPVKILNNLYYVGTHDLGVYLITTSAGHILINTGVNDSAPAIRSNVEAVGFKLSDVKLLLATHGHWDHVGAMAEMKRLTGARMLMHEGDADMLETGGGIDFRFPNGRGTIYEPVKVDQRLKDGDKVTLGDVDLTVHHHPGHTKGATTFTYTTREAGRTYNVAIINMASINPGVQVRFMPGFPEILKAYKTTLARQKELKPDVWVASHAPQFNMYDKYKPGDAYDPNRFVDPQGYQAKLAFYEKLVEANVAKGEKAQ